MSNYNSVTFDAENNEVPTGDEGHVMRLSQAMVGNTAAPGTDRTAQIRHTVKGDHPEAQGGYVAVSEFDDKETQALKRWQNAKHEWKMHVRGIEINEQRGRPVSQLDRDREISLRHDTAIAYGLAGGSVAELLED